MRPQRGFVALLMIVLIAVGVFGAMAAWVASEPPPSKQTINQQVLAQAKEALLAYVAVSSTPASMSTQKTRLPCPDRDGDGVADTAADTNNCGLVRQTALGLLPWSTLGLPPLRDADGECLWYAVSGDFKDAVDPTATTPVNADTDGAIMVTNEAGSSLAAKLVAVVFAPGAKLGSQIRTDSSTIGADKPCATPTSATPSGGAAADVSGYLDSGKIDATVTPPAITFVQLTGAVDKQSLLNDQLVWIAADDYAATATQRNADVLKQALINASAAVDQRMPFAAAAPGEVCEQNRYSGFLPKSCSYTYGFDTNGAPLIRTFDLALVAPQAALDNWHLLAFYAVAPGCALDASSCNAATAPVLKPPVASAARAVLLVRGKQQPGCRLADSNLTVLDQWLPCIENPSNRTALLSPMVSQARTFVTPDKRPTSNDILRELP